MYDLMKNNTEAKRMTAVVAKHFTIGAIAVLSTAANGIMIFLFIYVRQLRTTANLFLLSMSCADFLMGAMALPLLLAVQNGGFGEEGDKSFVRSCEAVMCLCVFILTITALTLFTFSVERYILIVHPLTYRVKLTTKRVVIVVACLWLYSILFSIIPHTGWKVANLLHNYNMSYDEIVVPGIPICRLEVAVSGHYIGILFCLHVVPPLVVVPCLHIHIIKTIQRFVKRRQRAGTGIHEVRQRQNPTRDDRPTVTVTHGSSQMYVHRPPIIQAGVSRQYTLNACPISEHINEDTKMSHELPPGQVSPEPIAHGQMTERRTHKVSTSSEQSNSTANKRSHRMLIVVITYYLLSWLPLMIFYGAVTQGFTVGLLTREHIQYSPIPYEYGQVALILGVANSAINPFLYGLSNRTIRTALIKTMRPRCK